LTILKHLDERKAQKREEDRVKEGGKEKEGTNPRNDEKIDCFLFLPVIIRTMARFVDFRAGATLRLELGLGRGLELVSGSDVEEELELELVSQKEKCQGLELGLELGLGLGLDFVGDESALSPDDVIRLWGLG
jgi:hypothetical protein